MLFYTQKSLIARWFFERRGTIKDMTTQGTLFVVATPIGNLEEITLRAIRVLNEATIILCEDTRVTNALLNRIRNYDLGFKNSEKKSLIRLDENVQLRMIPKVVGWLEEGVNVVLVTDAGMPCVSDPGWRVVNAVRETGYKVEVISGASALTTAIAASGMDSTRIWFGGFLPKKTGNRMAMLEEVQRQLSSEASTMAVIYESPQRLRDTLHEILQMVGDVQIAACGELTKMYEKVIRGSVKQVMEQLPQEIRGEWVVVLGRG
jgi:16S rRNA (cytidine1402-2'-O)-methyltransferase